MTYLSELAREIRAHVPASDLPDEDTESLFLAYAVLLLAKGDLVTAADVHNAWVAWMAVRDPDHESLVPYEELDAEAAQMDEPYVQAIRAVHRSKEQPAPRRRLMRKRKVGEPRPSDATIWAALVPGGREKIDTEKERSLLLDLYKLMVGSSEALVSRRQGVNTFFLTANGALLTGIGLVVQNPSMPRPTAFAVLALALTGAILAFAWRSLLVSFGQLNTGKFAVINRLESLLPAAVYSAEWKALAEGQDPRVYRSFTSREIWAPNASIMIYSVTGAVCLSVILGLWTP